MSRRRLALLFIGLFSALAGSATTTFLRLHHCEQGSGQWDFRRRACVMPAGIPQAPLPATDSLIGFGVTIALAGALFVLNARRTSTP